MDIHGQICLTQAVSKQSNWIVALMAYCYVIYLYQYEPTMATDDAEMQEVLTYV